MSSNPTTRGLGELPTLAVHEFAVEPTVVIGSRSVRVRWRVDGAARAQLRCSRAGGGDTIPLRARAGQLELPAIAHDCVVTLALWSEADLADEAPTYATSIPVRRVAKWLVALVLFSISSLLVGVWYCSEYLFKGAQVVDRSTWLAGGVGVARLIALASTVLGAPVVLALVRMRQDDIFGLLTAELLRRSRLATGVSLGLLVLVGSYVAFVQWNTRELWFRSSLSRPVYFWAAHRGAHEGDGEARLRLEVPPGLTSARVLALDEPLANHDPARVHWHDEPALPSSEIIELSCGVELLRGAPVAGAFVRWSPTETSTFVDGRAYLAVPNCSSFPSRATLVEREREGGRTRHRLLWTFDVPTDDHAELTHASTSMALPAADGHHVVLGVSGSWESTTRCAADGSCELELPARVQGRGCAASRTFDPTATPAYADGELHASDGTVEACISGIPPAEREEPMVDCGGDGSWSLRFRPASLEPAALRLGKLSVCAGELDASTVSIEHGAVVFAGKLPARGWIPWPELPPTAQLRVTIAGETQSRGVTQVDDGMVVQLETPTIATVRLDVTVDGTPQLRLRDARLLHVGAQPLCPVPTSAITRVERDHVRIDALPRWMLAKRANVWLLEARGQATASCRIELERGALACTRRRK